MSRITSGVGLITGIPIEDTVNKLMAIAARPRDLLSGRNQALGSEKAAVQQLASLVLALKFEASQLGNKSLFSAKTITSSDPAALAAASGGGGGSAGAGD